MARQLKDEAHRAACERAKGCAELRARLLAAVYDYANADDATEAETSRLRAMALIRALLVAERGRYTAARTPHPTQ